MFLFFGYYNVFDDKSCFFCYLQWFWLHFTKNTDIQRNETKIRLFNVLHLCGTSCFEHGFCLTPIKNFVIYKTKNLNTTTQNNPENKTKLALLHLLYFCGMSYNFEQVAFTSFNQHFHHSANHETTNQDFFPKVKLFLSKGNLFAIKFV